MPRPPVLGSVTLAALGLLAALGPPARAQYVPFVVSAQGRLNGAVGLRDSLASASGRGGVAVRADLAPARRFGVAVALAYDRVALRHPEGAMLLCYPTSVPADRCQRTMPRAYTVEEWGWDHWERLYRNEVKSLDANYAATLAPVQDVRLLSAAVLPAARARFGRVRLSVEAGPSVTLARRTLYLDERWAKTLRGADGYVFDYRFRNNAPDKTGYALGLDGGLDARVRLVGRLDAVVGARYRRFLVRRSETDTGLSPRRTEDDAALPLDDLFGLELGLALR